MTLEHKNGQRSINNYKTTGRYIKKTLKLKCEIYQLSLTVSYIFTEFIVHNEIRRQEILYPPSKCDRNSRNIVYYMDVHRNSPQS